MGMVNDLQSGSLSCVRKLLPTIAVNGDGNRDVITCDKPQTLKSDPFDTLMSSWNKQRKEKTTKNKTRNYVHTHTKFVTKFNWSFGHKPTNSIQVPVWSNSHRTWVSNWRKNSPPQWERLIKIIHGRPFSPLHCTCLKTLVGYHRSFQSVIISLMAELHSLPICQNPF